VTPEIFITFPLSADSEDRVQVGSFIITSQLDVKDWHAYLAEHALTNAILPFQWLEGSGHQRMIILEWCVYVS